MAKINYLDKGERKTMKVKKPIAVKYKCACGCEVVYESDEKPKKLEKCWKCQEKNS